MTCPHKAFAVMHNITRFHGADENKAHRFEIEVSVRCAQCGADFEFLCDDEAGIPQRFASISAEMVPTVAADKQKAIH